MQLSERYISKEMLIYKYNPYYYQQLFKDIEDEINEMYHMSVATVSESDEGQLMVVGYRVEDIAIEITERRERLERLKAKAARHCIHLQTALTKVPPKYRVMLQKAQTTMNIRAMNNNQINSVSNALWHVIDAGKTNISSEDEGALEKV